MSIISLNRVSLQVAGNLVLDQASWQVHEGERIALLGRNGAGKSSLLKLLQAELQVDNGVLSFAQGLRIASLPQNVPAIVDDSVYHFLVKDLPEIGNILSEFHHYSKCNDEKALSLCQQKIDNAQAWDLLPRIEMMATKLDIDINASMQDLSGGMKRRVLLASALIADPDVLLLDEPTNHLDIGSIEWLESYLKNWHGTLILVTHDREFLEKVTHAIVEIDRGKLGFFDCDYKTYLERREAMYLAEEKENDLFDKRLGDEEIWIRTGIQARRTRNEGRVRALKAMREAYKARKQKISKIDSMDLNVQRSGFLVFDVQKLHYSIQGRCLFKDLSLLVTRGDKLGIIGPNGCGKTTLIRLLLGDIQPDSGSIKRGTALEIAYFDQLRHQLDEQKTVMQNVAEGSDYVTIQGKQKHVASYLRDFLFSPERFNQLVANLSGGERNRLLLAKLFAKPVNLLVMDEPTNDLDMETLELLESMLLEYSGTLLLISHDRSFINQVVTSVLVAEQDGIWTESVGGYDDYRMQVQQKKHKPQQQAQPTQKHQKTKLHLHREMQSILKKIESLEKTIAHKHQEMADPAFYSQDEEKIAAFHQKLKDEEILLAEYYTAWESLESKT